jgi:hypothetical protein
MSQLVVWFGVWRYTLLILTIMFEYSRAKLSYINDTTNIFHFTKEIYFILTAIARITRPYEPAKG